MKKLLLFVALISSMSLQAVDFSFVNELEWQAGQYTEGREDGADETNNLSLLTYTPIINVKSEVLDFNFIPMFTMLHSDDPVYNAITNEIYEEKDFFVKSLYLKYKAGNHKFLFGILPLSYNGYLGYKNDYNERGEGLHTIIDRDILAGMYIYDVNEDFSIKVLYGGSYFNNDSIPTGQYGAHLEKELVVITNYRKDKFRFDTTFMMQETYTEESDKVMSKLGALGIGMVYDDSEYTGNVFYNIVSFSRHDFKGISLSHIQNHMPDVTADDVKNDPTFATEARVDYGWSNLLGYRKDFEIKGTENFFNVEWFHASDNFMSANLGNIYKGDATDMYYVNNDSISLTIGHIFNENHYVKFVHSHVEFDKLPAVGNRAVRIPVEDHRFGNTTSYIYSKIVWNFKF